MNEYALAGVDPTKIRPFKEMMLAIAEKTVSFPNRHQAIVGRLGIELAIKRNFSWRLARPVLEGVGNKNWISEWMYANAGDGNPHYRCIGIDATMMAANDILVQGAMPITFNDEVVASDSDWFDDVVRATDFAAGVYAGCEMASMALVGGESPSYTYLVKAHEPVESAPVISGCVSGIIAPTYNAIDETKMVAGDHIIGLRSSGLHSNGISLVIKRMMENKDKFLAKLPSGKTIGEVALTPTMCYVPVARAWLENHVRLHRLLPGTGDGVAKLAVNKSGFNFRIYSWPEVPEFFRYFREIGVDLETCLRTFNWGVGFYAFVPDADVEEALRIAKQLGYEAMEIGVVEEGDGAVIFGPENNLILRPV